MPSSHSLLIAVIFTSYMGGMAGLIAYICSTGRHRSGDGQGEDGQRDRDPGPAALPLAA